MNEEFISALEQIAEEKKIGKDHEKRFRWDVFWTARRYLNGNFISDILYSYLNDDHIDTALKKIVKEIY